MLPRALLGGAAGWSFPRGRGDSGEKATLSLGTAGGRIQPQSGPALPVSRGVDINTGAQREGGRRGDLFLFAQPHTTGEEESRERR